MTDEHTPDGAPDFDADAFRRFEHDGWTEVAARYHESFGKITAQSVEALLDAAGVGAGERVLDLACGSGRNAAAAVRRGASVTGLDLSRAMVEDAAARCPDVRFEVGDAEHPPFPPGSFDAVVCGFGVLHFPDAAAALAAVHGILRPGGRFACSVWCPADRSPYLALIRDAIARHGSQEVGLPAGPPAYQYGEPARLESLFAGAGFEQVRSFEVPVVVHMTRENEVLDALFEGGVRSRKLLEAQAPGVLEHIVAFAAERARQFRVGAHIEIPRPALVCAGVRP